MLPLSNGLGGGRHRKVQDHDVFLYDSLSCHPVRSTPLNKSSIGIAASYRYVFRIRDLMVAIQYKVLLNPVIRLMGDVSYETSQFANLHPPS